MAVNLSALLAGANSVASHPITKGGALTALITGGLYAASAAGLAVPGWALLIGPVAGSLLYKFLPSKDQQKIDELTQEIVDTAHDIPDIHTYDEYPSDPVAPPSPNNLNQG